MLVLTRKENQKIILSNGVVITVLESDRYKARIGIEAPHDVSIMREELLERECISERKWYVEVYIADGIGGTKFPSESYGPFGNEDRAKIYAEGISGAVATQWPKAAKSEKLSQ